MSSLLNSCVATCCSGAPWKYRMVLVESSARSLPAAVILKRMLHWSSGSPVLSVPQDMLTRLDVRVTTTLGRGAVESQARRASASQGRRVFREERTRQIYQRVARSHGASGHTFSLD